MKTADGNYAVIDIGGGRYTLYAHMSPRSVRVRPGQRVRTGQVIGKLGNTGNTDAPHLHFHVMDGRSALSSNGLPYVFRSFTGRGVVTDEAPLFAGTPAPIARDRLAGPRRNRLPLNDQVIDFGG